MRRNWLDKLYRILHPSSRVGCRNKALPVILLATLLLGTSGHLNAANIDLIWLIQQGGTEITLDPANTYVLNTEYWVTKNLTIRGNGATVQAQGPLHAKTSGITLTIDGCVIQSWGWGALAATNGSFLVVRNSQLSVSGGTAIYAAGSTVTVEQNSSITSSQIGINLSSGSAGYLHSISITGCPFAVQVEGASTQVSIDQSSKIEYSGQGTGVGLVKGASASVRDSTLIGFSNAIDVQPASPGGTAKIQNCTFQNNNVSAISVVSAIDVLFSGCRVQGALQDGVYFEQSTGVVENSEIIDSLNSGVTFWACSNGATIRNCLVKNSAHQGLNIVADSAGTPSLNIQVVNNTLVGNTIANLLIDAKSTARLQGNIFSKAPDVSVRSNGAQGVTFESSLVSGSYYGLEVKSGSSVNLLLSSITQNINGALVYNNSYLNSQQSWWNDATGGWSIFVNDGAWVNGRYSSFGPAGSQGFYNNYVYSCDMASNYWAAADGPYTPWAVGSGSGSVLAWDYYTGQTVIYKPFLSEPPVESVSSNLSLPSGGGLTWDSTLGVTLYLTATASGGGQSNELAGVLRLNDTTHLSAIQPPSNLLAGRLYVVWVSTALRSNSSNGALQFYVPVQQDSVSLYRREIDGSWTLLSSEWDAANRVLTYRTDNTHLLNGTFALTGEPPGFLAAGDLNGDGYQDLIEVTNSGDIYYSLNAGYSWTQIWGNLSQIASGDLNGDGRDDIVGVTSAGQIFYYTGLTSWVCVPGTLKQIAAGDLNGDGRADLLGVTADGQIYYSLDLANWQSMWGQLNSITAGDLNGDGRDDIAGLTADGQIYYSLDLTSWVHVSGQLSQLSAGKISANACDGLVGVTANGSIYYLADLTGWWQLLPGKLNQVITWSYWGARWIAGLTSSNEIYATYDYSNWYCLTGP